MPAVAKVKDVKTKEKKTFTVCFNIVRPDDIKLESNGRGGSNGGSNGGGSDWIN